MYNAGENRRIVHVVSHHEDIPSQISGFLIPQSYRSRSEVAAIRVVPRLAWAREIVIPTRIYVVIPAAILVAVLTLSTTKWLSDGNDVIAAPIVVVESDELPEPMPLHYGAQSLLSHPNFFADTLNSFITEGLSFIEADLAEMRLTYYFEGEKVFSAPILSKGKEGSWWETPSGLYDVQLKESSHFSSFGNVHQPWSMIFQGNFFIHGWPKYPDGTPVPEGYSGGCIRLGDEDAEELYRQVPLGTPVLVHESDFIQDNFVYEPKAPDISAPYYLVADIKNNAVLVSSDLNAKAPIASITKLMTALVAAEFINLDDEVYVSQEKYVSTLIPRLNGRWRVSMYSLLQLLLVESSNEAAEVIATQVGRDRFVKLMNEKSLALGLENTTFTDPSGLDDGNVSTVSDLLRLLQYIHNNRSFILELTRDQDLPSAYKSGEFGELENFNVIENVDNFIGGKVGETLAAGQTSVSLHRIDINGTERTLAFIILGSSDREQDILKLLEYTEDQFVR